MARWRTHNKRAQRKRERDAEFLCNIDKMLVPALEEIVQDAFRAAFANLASSMERAAAAWAKASEGRWLALDAKYARRRRREQWPEVILEDILDAEYIE